jgi:hypothetical protein
MCILNAEAIWERLKDKYTAEDIVALLEISADDLQDMGIVTFIADNREELDDILEDAGVLDEI